MPIHPELSKVVSDESRNNYFNLLNQTGVAWYDYENYFNGDAFVDIHHVTFDSAKSFSSVFADLIIQELT